MEHSSIEEMMKIIVYKFIFKCYIITKMNSSKMK